MNDKSTDETETENENETEVEKHIWTYRKSVSHLTSSEHSMNDERKEIIRQALEFDIIDIRSFSGYKGDALVEITTMEPDVIQSLKKIAETLGFETVIRKDMLMVHQIYCISHPTDEYELKE